MGGGGFHGYLYAVHGPLSVTQASMILKEIPRFYEMIQNIFKLGL